MMTAQALIGDLQALGTPEKAKSSAWFFKTGKGQYGYGDVFFGVTVPEQRLIARRYRELPLEEIGKLLQHTVHECRLTALFILVGQYSRGDAQSRRRIARFYLTHRKRINNWDLVDSSAPYILGQYLLEKDRSILYEFARSHHLWERRIAIIATAAFIREDEFDDTLNIAALLLNDRHDLIHKAVGWMLREVGKKSRETEEAFLKKHAAVMPRTMLRYAIEKFPAEKRQMYLTLR